MLSVFRFSQVKLRSSFYHDPSVSYEFFKDGFQRKRLGHAINQRHHIEMKCVLKLGVLVEKIQHFLRMSATLQVNRYANVFG